MRDAREALDELWRFAAPRASLVSRQRITKARDTLAPALDRAERLEAKLDVDREPRCHVCGERMNPKREPCTWGFDEDGGPMGPGVWVKHLACHERSNPKVERLTRERDEWKDAGVKARREAMDAHAAALAANRERDEARNALDWWGVDRGLDHAEMVQRYRDGRATEARSGEAGDAPRGASR